MRNALMDNYKLFKIRFFFGYSDLRQALVLLAVGILLLLPAPLGSNLPVGGGGDLLVSHWPMAQLIKRTFEQSHHLALWNPYFGGGLPLAANPLAALFYPPTQLVYLLPLQAYFYLLILGHLVFAGLGMLLLARHALKLSTLGALLAALSFMATPRLVSHLGAGHLTLLQTVSWFLWLALACWATVHRPHWGPFLALTIALTLLAGHPQLAYYGLLMTAVLACWLLVQRWRQQGRKVLVWSLAALVCASLLGLVIAAIHLLPLMELTALSTRQVSLKSTENYPLPNFLLALVNPIANPRLPWEGMITPGILVLVLVFYAILRRYTACKQLAYK